MQASTPIPTGRLPHRRCGLSFAIQDRVLRPLNLRRSCRDPGGATFFPIPRPQQL